jgi:hypothetical protein
MLGCPPSRLEVLLQVLGEHTHPLKEVSDCRLDQ